MIVCTCDSCGKQVERWNTLMITFPTDNYKREICDDCKKRINNNLMEFLNSIPLVPDGENE